MTYASRNATPHTPAVSARPVPCWRIATLLVAFLMVGGGVVDATPRSNRAAGPPVQDTSDAELRGVWLTDVSNVLDSRDNIEEAMAFLEEYNFNAVFPVVWNQAATTYPSAVMDSLIDRPIDPQYGDRDPLQELIEEAHERGIAVIPWFEYGFAASFESGGGAIIEEKPGWAAKDQAGNLLKKNGFEWMNPYRPAVRDFMMSLIMEVVRNYDVDGVQGDDRLPAQPVEGGYSEFTKDLYRQEHDGQDPPSNESDPEWMAWRADILNDFAQRIYDNVKAVDDDLIVSWSPSVWNFSYREYLQDWPTWINQGSTDLIHPQVYRKSPAQYEATLDAQSADQVGWDEEEVIGFYPGVLIKSGGYLVTASDIKDMVQANRDHGYQGEVLFYFDGLRQFDNLVADALKESHYQEPVPLPFDRASASPQECSSAQFECEWERSKAKGNAPPYIATDSEVANGNGYQARGLAYGEVGDGSGTTVERLFVVSTKDSLAVHVLDPANGERLSALEVSGVESTARPLNDIGVTDDGIIYACNLAPGPNGGEPLKCYRWDHLQDTPTKVIDGLGTDDERLGSHISVTGRADDNSLLLHTASASNENVYQFETSDNGFTFAASDRVAGPSSGNPNVESVHPHPNGQGGFYHTWIHEPAAQYDASDGEVGQLPSGVADSLTSITLFEAAGQTFLAGTKVNYAGAGGQAVAGSDARVRIADVTNGAGNATFYGETTDLGDTENVQANSDVAVRPNGDATATVFVLSTNNGVGAFTTTQAPLPVELASFRGAQVQEGAVQLTWTTASETNNAGFRIEHRTAEGDWESLGYVESKAVGGTTAEAHTYRFTTEALETGTHHFRLKQLDFDGTSTLSSTVMVDVQMRQALRLSAPAPNPITDAATVSFAVKETEEATVTLYDVLGQKVRTLHDGRATGGEPHMLRIRADDLASGVYLLRLQVDDKIRTRRLTVVR